MGTVEIVLLVIGIICVIVGIILGLTDNNEKEATESSASDYDAASQVSQVAQTIEDKTEARLDKISNTKILEMNEYADGVLKEINRNHNEVMFMYDMLNEKDKEIKTTVKDVNVTRMNRGYAYNDAKQQSAMEEPKIVMQDIEDFVLDESLSTHDKIRKLYSNGYNDVEIAKRLKIGVGEVRLVINLSSGNN